ncbi:putative ABC transporter ATP-binding protein YwjA [Lentibacillus sp. JNUCC-1]|nr:putative ABC transporter ATP-binding protein YwjA [Lentibacillus sp. JNUCC-1]
MIKRFFSYYRPHRRLFIIDFTSAVIVAIFELFFPLAVQWFIDELIPESEWNLIITVSVLLLIVYLLSTGLQYVVTYWGA